MNSPKGNREGEMKDKENSKYGIDSWIRKMEAERIHLL